MLDFGDTPRERSVNSDVITTAGSWIAWNKPRNIVMVDILAVAAGGGGGGGRSVSNTTNYGGTGGGAGSVGSLLIPASYLPDTIYIFVGLGGAPGTSTANGSVGGNTVISTQPDSTTNNSILVCYGGTGGIAGTNTTPTAGSANTATPALFSIGYGGISNLVQGRGSLSQVASQYAPANTQYESLFTLTCPGGAGAGGVNNKGSNITTTSSFLSPVLLNGYMLFKPLVSLGGAGGNSSTSTASSGTDGGEGGLGSGGGGGGIGGGAGGSAGAGGRGGNGFAIIKSW